MRDPTLDEPRAVPVAPTYVPPTGPAMTGPAIATPHAGHARPRHTRDPGPVDLECASPSELDGFEARYTRRGLLGQGGMGEVHLVRDCIVGRDVALKLVRPGGGSQPGLVPRLIREARVQGQLEHPAVVPVYDLGVTPEGATFFTMQRVHGVTLAHVLERLAAGDPEAAEQYSRRKLLTAFSRLSLAADFAHRRGVVHRDIKPANVMFGDYGEVYLLDWGLAKIAGLGEAAPPIVTAAERAPTEIGTADGTILGTPGYMAPEQVRGEWQTLDARADVYALGAVLFEILTQEPLHGRGGSPALFASTLLGADACAHRRTPQADVPPELEAVCVRATASAPAQRFGSAREVHRAVERFLDGDRDLELRRALASAHAQAAEVAARRARTEEPDAADARAAALREAGRALALDPTHGPAAKTLVTLLVEPPREVPAEARAEIESSARARERLAARVAAIWYLLVLAFVPIFFWMGIRDWAQAVAFLALTMGAIALSVAFSKGLAPSAAMRVTWLILATLAVIVSSRMFGPFVLLPCLAIVNTIGFVLNPQRLGRTAIVVAGCLAIAVPVALEWAGLWPRSYVFHDGVMSIVPQMHALEPTPTMTFLLLANLVFVLGSAVANGRIRDALSEAERRVRLQAWQLRQLVAEAPMERAPEPGPAPSRTEGTESALAESTFVSPSDAATVDFGRLDPLEKLGFERRYTGENLQAGGAPRCHDELIGREVAIQIARVEPGAEPSSAALFLREARIQGQLEHPSIAPVYDVGAAPDGCVYFTTKRVRGRTLAEVQGALRRRDPQALATYSRRVLLTAFGSACLAVELAHRRGLVHRNLHPDNLVLGDFGEVYVVGWGSAEVLPARSSERQGVQARAEIARLDPRDDVYALGAILSGIVALEPLHARDLGPAPQSAGPIGSQHSDGRSMPSGLLASVCARATALDPQQRYGNARELQEAVEAYLERLRDDELRRELALAHAGSASDAEDLALGTGAEANDARRRALREVGRTLALDPSNAAAIRTLERLLQEPPKQIPAEARGELEASAHEQWRLSAKLGGVGYLLMFPFIPLFLWMGIRDIGSAAVCLALGLGAIAAGIAQSRRERPSPALQFLLLVLSTLALVATSRMFGPFVLLPCLAIVNTVGFVLTPTASKRAWFIAAGCFAIALPVVLEWADVWPPSYVFHQGLMSIRPQMHSLEETATMVFLLAVNLTIVVGSALAIARFRDALARAEERLQLQAWKLRQLVPESVGTFAQRRGLREHRAT